MSKQPKAKRKKELVWTSLNGQARPISEMTNDHLINTINYLRQRATLLSLRLELDDRLLLKEGAGQYAAPEPILPSDISPKHYPAMVKEAIKRGLMREKQW